MCKISDAPYIISSLLRRIATPAQTHITAEKGWLHFTPMDVEISHCHK